MPTFTTTPAPRSGAPVTEGDMPFCGYRTHWRVRGSVEESLAAGKAPLLALHGGPGSTHNYFEVFDALAHDGRAVVLYDQLGCGDSYVEGRPDLWRAQTWVDELAALREHLGLERMHLLGQSWGGMLAIQYLCDCAPSGVASAILSSTLPSSQLWAREQHRMIAQMEPAQRDALLAAERTGAYDDPAYLEALDRYMELHCSDGVPGPGAPACLRRPKRSGKESYLVAWGPNEFTASGTLASWDYTDKLADIAVPTLVVSGTDDLCTPLVAKTMADRIPHARWELFEGCRHMCFIDDMPRYLHLLDAWMAQND